LARSRGDQRPPRTEPAFECAYGIAFAEAGSDYASNPLEAEAFNFVDAHEAQI
jgi:hypothetical protein